MKKIGFYGIVLSLAVIFFGCAAQHSYGAEGNSSHGDGGIYQPQSQEGMGYDDAEKALAHMLSGEWEPFGIKYNGIPEINNYARIDDLNRLFAGGNQTFRLYDRKNVLEYVLFSSIDITSGLIRISPQLAIPLAELTDPIKVEKKGEKYKYVVDAGLLSFHFKGREAAYQFSDMLCTVQKLRISEDQDRLARFESLAAQYRELVEKPAITEAQRRFIVQANALNQSKDYVGAIDLYTKAVEVDPVAYPSAYFNLALLYAQIHCYNAAIKCMNQYLLLVPEAEDARSAQDKIYEWELLKQK